MCGSTLFHVLRKQNISLYAFVSSNAVLVKKKRRGIFAILRPFPVGRYFDFYTALSQIHLLYLFSLKVQGTKKKDTKKKCRKGVSTSAEVDRKAPPLETASL